MCPQIAKSETGRQVVNQLVDSLRINTTTLAGILNVSVRSLPNWYEVPVERGRGKFLRLMALRSIVLEALELGLSSSQIISTINKPVPGDSEGRALLYHICESYDHPLTMAVARQLMTKALEEGRGMPTAAAERYSIKDIFRQEYGSINDENLRSAAASNPSIVCQLLDSNELSPQAMGAAAEALGSTQEVEHVERLLRLLSHENAFAREGAVKGLGAMLYHGVEVDQILESLKSHSDTSPAVREAVEEAIELAE